MRLIKDANQLEYAPRACSVTNRIDGDFVDFQKIIDGLRGPHRLYLKREIVEEAAELCNMVPRREMEAEIERLRGEFAALDAKIEQLRSFADAHEKLEELSQDLDNGEGI